MKPDNASPFAGMTMEGLSAAFAASLAASEALIGVYLRPCSSDDPTASSWIDEEQNRIILLAQEIAHEAERRAPSDRGDIRERAEILVRWGLECGSWPDILNAVHIEAIQETTCQPPRVLTPA